MPSCPDGEREQRRGRSATLGVAVEGAEPAQVVFELGGGDPVEANYPGLPAAVTSVDVLDMPGAAAALAAGGVEGLIRNPLGPGGRRECGAGIGTQDCIRGHAVCEQGGI